MRTFIATCVIASSVLAAQDEPPCGPFLNPMDTIRLPEWDGEDGTTGRIMTLSTTQPEFAETSEVAVFYTLPEVGGRAIVYDMRGDIEWTNKRDVENTIKYRQSIYVGEEFVPFIPRDSPVCWDPEAMRLVTLFEKTLAANETIEEDPIAWTIELRKANQVADINGDGIVNSADQGLLMASWNTDDYRSDLNLDGTVDSGDLGILLSQWSESAAEQ